MPVMLRLHLLKWTTSRRRRRDCFDLFMMRKLVRPLTERPERLHPASLIVYILSVLTIPQFLHFLFRLV